MVEMFVLVQNKMSEVFLTCDSCGIEAGDVVLCYDPYAHEMNNQIIETNLCDKCFEKRVEEILNA